MNFLNKIENFINFLLIRLFELCLKLVPVPVKKLFSQISNQLSRIKELPGLAKKFALWLFTYVKGAALSMNYKEVFLETYKKSLAEYKTRSSKGMGAFKKIFLMPFLMMGHWLQGLNALQSMLLLGFTTASILSVIGIGFSGKRLLENNFGSRAPASVEDEITYDRPAYYKKETKHFEVTNFRLPVYFAKVNEVRSVDIDFVATTSNRQSRMFLEKKEFQLRDHLILNVEPSVASFPLEEEGKEIIRKKLHMELNDYLRTHHVDGEVVELKITYVLAN
jgi:flagellar basal body-associated protein FliL